jgi:hypothetical protein
MTFFAFHSFAFLFVSFGASGTESPCCSERDLGANSHLSISIVSEIILVN